MKLIVYVLSILGFLIWIPAIIAAEQTESLIEQLRTEKLREIRTELEDWDQSVLGFRSEHNFVFSTGTSSGKWRLKRFGSMRNKTYASSGIYSKLQYSFHLPIYKGFGYFLGTAMGYVFEDQPEQDIYSPSAFLLPGLVCGLAYNFSPGFRLSSGLEYYLERWEGLQEKDGVEKDIEISSTARTIDLFAAVDIFFRLKWAIRFEAHNRKATFKKPDSGKNSDLDAAIEKEDEWLGIGIVHHLM